MRTVHITWSAFWLAALFVVVYAILFTASPSLADTDCRQTTNRLDGQLGGNPFSVPARLDLGGGDNVGLSSQDCRNANFDSWQQQWRRSAGIAAALENPTMKPGKLSLAVNWANIGMDEDVNAVGFTVGGALPLGLLNGAIDQVGFSAGLAGDTAGDDLGVRASVEVVLDIF